MPRTLECVQCTENDSFHNRAESPTLVQAAGSVRADTVYVHAILTHTDSLHQSLARVCVHEQIDFFLFLRSSQAVLLITTLDRSRTALLARVSNAQRLLVATFCTLGNNTRPFQAKNEGDEQD